jgi:hypothetical protein
LNKKNKGKNCRNRLEEEKKAMLERRRRRAERAKRLSQIPSCKK